MKAGDERWWNLLVGQKRNLYLGAEFEQSKFQEFAFAKRLGGCEVMSNNTGNQQWRGI
jgi:hypothetical protein